MDGGREGEGGGGGERGRNRKGERGGREQGREIGCEGERGDNGRSNFVASIGVESGCGAN